MKQIVIFLITIFTVLFLQQSKVYSQNKQYKNIADIPSIYFGKWVQDHDDIESQKKAQAKFG